MSLFFYMPKKKRPESTIIKACKRGSLTCSSLFLSVLIVFGCIYVFLALRLPDVSQLKDIQLQVPLRIYTNDGKLISIFGEKKRIPAKLVEVPQQLINAILDTEDQRFFEHSGVDLISLMRAAKTVFFTGKKSQGASTITMQVARNFFLNREKTYMRKLNEIMLAFKIDQLLSKEEVLELYINKIYLGQRAYGVAAAAKVYYGKDLNQLTLAELALIAGLPQAPSRDNPIVNPRAALERRNHVLERMYENGHINRDAYKEAIAAPLTAKYHEQVTEVDAPYVAEMVRLAVIQQFGTDIYDSGYSVYTTIDSRLQNIANQATRNGVLKYDKRHGLREADKASKIEVALVALNPHDGAVLALNGGFSYQRSNFNRATQAGRLTGSAFKPFIYSAALEKGYTLASIINDAPVVLEDANSNILWRPQNDTLRFYGPTRLRVGLTQSRNVVSVRLLQGIGIKYAIDYLERFGFARKDLPFGLSLALGTASLSPMQLTAGYAIFANGGYQVTPYFIKTIKNQDGEVIFTAHPEEVPSQLNSLQDKESWEDDAQKNNFAERVISPQNAYLITDALKDVIRHGTAISATSLKRSDLAGKTGTTNNQNDAWFSGFNSDLVVSTWMGFDQPQSLHEYGAQTALPVWIDFMAEALKGSPQRSMPMPEGIVAVRIDPVTGFLADQQQKDSIVELFTSDSVPTKIATQPSASDVNEDAAPLF